jgi:hypothetical protein
MKTKTHFAFRIDTWDNDGNSIVEHLDEERPWDQTLSGGEKQRLAFARIFSPTRYNRAGRSNCGARLTE